MKKFGAKDEDFVIKINNRKIVNALYEKFGLNDTDSYKASKIIDKKNKISKEAFSESMKEIIGEKSEEFVYLLESNEKLIEFLGNENKEVKDLVALIDSLRDNGITNISFDPTLMRGFDYYTGTVFEVFDLHPDNNRSVFGGGRYDDLLDIFGAKKVPAVGFGAGDVTMLDFLESHELLPKYSSSTKLYICTLDEQMLGPANSLAQKVRDAGINVAVDLSAKKLGDQIKTADKQGVPFVLCIGENEVKSSQYPLKNMKTGEEKKLKEEEVISELQAILEDGK